MGSVTDLVQGGLEFSVEPVVWFWSVLQAVGTRRVLCVLRTNSVKENFYKHKRDFEQRLCNRGYPTTPDHKVMTEVQFSDRAEALRNKTKKAKEILPFVTTYNPATPNLKKILMKHWHIIQQQPRLAHIFKQPPIVSYRAEKSLKDVLVRTKLPLITSQS